MDETSKWGQLEFCEAVHPRLVGALSLYCGDRDVAEELTQDTLVKVCQRWQEVSRMNNASAWAHRVAFNLAASRFRRRAAERRALRRLAARPTGVAGPAEPVDPALTAALADLPPRQRQAVVLRFYADMAVGDAAQVMGCAEGTVKALTHKALQQVRRRLDPDTERSDVA